MITIILIMALLASVSLVAQENIDSILFSIEENNSTLKALREEKKQTLRNWGIRQVYTCPTLM